MVLRNDILGLLYSCNTVKQHADPAVVNAWVATRVHRLFRNLPRLTSSAILMVSTAPPGQLAAMHLMSVGSLSNANAVVISPKVKLPLHEVDLYHEIHVCKTAVAHSSSFYNLSAWLVLIMIADSLHVVLLCSLLHCCLPVAETWHVTTAALSLLDLAEWCALHCHEICK